MKFKDYLDTELNEGLEKEASKFLNLIDNNQHTDALLEAAKLTKDKTLIKLAEAVHTIIILERQNPINEYSHQLYTRIHEAGRRKYGEDEWNSNVYNPQKRK